MENKTLLVFSEKNNSKKIYLVKDEVSHFYVFSGRSKNKSDLKIVMKNNQEFNFTDFNNTLVNEFIDNF
jgi:hypothetical protein